MNSMALTPTQRAERAETATERYRRMYKNAISKSQEGVGFVKGGVMAVAGGAAAGVVWSKFGSGLPGSAKIGDTRIEIDVAIGVGCIAAAAMGYGGKYAEDLGTFGGGMLAARAAAFTGKVLEERERR